MRTVTLSVTSIEETLRQAEAAFRGEPQGEFISFASVELLWKVLTPRRWDLLKVMAGQGPMTIREAARRTGRNVKSVHGDVDTLLNAGVLDRTEDGRVAFPYDAVRVEFEKAA